jgi:hypothetical protein
MATYYVRPDGNDSNTGLGSTTVLAWRTLQKALGATGIGSGDTVYVAPGHYNETVTVGGTYSAETQIIGDPTAAQFIGVNAGYVKHSQFSSTGTAARNITFLISSSGKNYLHFKNIYFEMAADNSTVSINMATGRFTKFTSCVFYNNLKPATASVSSYEIGTNSAGQTANIAISNCIFYGLKYGTIRGGTATGDTSTLTNTIFIGCGGESISVFGAGLTVYNCGFFAADTGLRISSGSASVYNSLFNQCTTAIMNNGTLTENYNRFIGNSVNVSGTYTPGGNSVSTGISGVESGYSLLHNLTNSVMFGSVQGSQNTSFGTASGAPVTDLFGIAWSGTSPDAGAVTFRSIGAVGQYLPTERNASTITIAPASTSQSIELYLGATGLTASTSGLTARYNRTRTASVSIPLVARTIAQAWTAGGFAEVDATNMPGVYRLDVPDAALAAGADDVTVVVRGASGTNGAVMTVKLSSGGLTEAQTASAVWGASVAGYSGASTFGGILTETSSVVIGIDGEVQDIPSNVWEELRTNHTTVGTFGQYVNAELVTPVTSAALVRMGPFEVRADGLGASDPLDIQKGAQHGIDIQCVDNNGAGIDITSATVTAKVYNSGATLVDTYSCTATYAADGRAQFVIDTTVTNTPGTYTATITRTTGASDTQIFGPLRIYVRDI